MCFKIGNRVTLIDDVLQGTVVGICDEMIQVQDDEGMTYHFHQRELILLKNDQRELSKFSDINNPLLNQKSVSERKPKQFFKKEKNDMVFEVDLHIHQLTDRTRGMDNFDMLTLQLNTAKKQLEYAIVKRFSRIVFIHGVGEGVLKRELQYLLRKYPVDFYDASYQKYGLGATEVYIYQNPKS
ncbi:MAG: DNA mismatch repair protein MutS [Flavobacteriales bacterium]|nr:DNA mismatch repair protein MutS [Flavobacteriales bacterium]